MQTPPRGSDDSIRLVWFCVCTDSPHKENCPSTSVHNTVTWAVVYFVKCLVKLSLVPAFFLNSCVKR